MVIQRTSDDGTDQGASYVTACINDALEYAKKFASERESVFVLVTGSMHLVGGVLSILDPGMSQV